MPERVSGLCNDFEPQIMGEPKQRQLGAWIAVGTQMPDARSTEPHSAR